MPETITPPGIAAPGGHYAHAVRHGDTVYISGQLPIAPDGSHHAEAEFAEQARIVLANLMAIAAVANAELVKVTAYLTDVADWPMFNSVYAETLGDARPARAVVPVPALHYGYRIEVEAVAAVRR